MPQRTPPAAARLAPLDALRAVAILLVLGTHAPALPAGAAPEWVVSFFRVLGRGGWIGVDLFFVISGFLISGLLFREYARTGELQIGRFLIRRAFKIYPAFYVMLAGTLAIGAALGRPLPGGHILLSEILFVQNYGPAMFPQTWSLAVEEHFYLLLPFGLLLLRGSGERPFAKVPQICLVLMLACLCARLLTADLLPYRPKTHLFATHLRIDTLILGVLLGWCHHFHPERLHAFASRWRPALCLAAAAFAAPAFFLTLGKAAVLPTFGLTSFALAGACLLLAALTCKTAPAFLAGIGRHSYSIYLWHMTLLLFGSAALPAAIHPLAKIALFFAGSIGLGMLMTMLVEAPALRLRDRLFPSRSRGAVAPAQEVAVLDEAAGPLVPAPKSVCSDLQAAS